MIDCNAIRYSSAVNKKRLLRRLSIKRKEMFVGSVGD